MSAPVKLDAATANPDSENADVSATAPSFEQKLNGFWAKNRKLLVLLCGVVLVVIVGREVSAINAGRSREQSATRYAAAATTPEGLRRFAEENADTALGGVAWLQVADAAYEADRFSDATAAYAQSLKGLGRGTALADRAALGLAVAQLKSGDDAQGRAGLAALADAATGSVAIRAEAAYHLAILSHVAGEQQAFQQRATQLAQIDPTSLWNQRLLSLQVTRALPGAAALAPQNAASESPLADPAAAAGAEPLIKFNVGN